MKKIIKILIISFSCVILSFFTLFGVRFYQFSKITNSRPLSFEEQNSLDDFLHLNYKNYGKIIKNLPYKISQTNLDIWAESAILVDVSNGNIIYEKNADEIIPPASMTKLFAMFVIEKEVEKGNLSYDQIIPLPPECWACNMPRDSSFMFLGKNHSVSLEELLLGLSICSGNDAAYALAYAVCDSMEEFVEKMNQVAKEFGLKNTHFVESSGYSELNSTTAREMAIFATKYLQLYPSSLKRFHGVKEFVYPKQHNLSSGEKIAPQFFGEKIPEIITNQFISKNTNPLLGVLEGCDGLKTGFINESGYNLSATVKRENTRFLSVTMKGPGNNSIEGQTGRVHDATELMEWAFSNFKDFSLDKFLQPKTIKIFGAKEKSLSLISATDVNTILVPILNESQNNDLDVKVDFFVPPTLFGQITQGEKVGKIKISLQNYILQEIDLLSDRTIKTSNFIIQFVDFFVQKLFN